MFVSIQRWVGRSLKQSRAELQSAGRISSNILLIRLTAASEWESSEIVREYISKAEEDARYHHEFWTEINGLFKNNCLQNIKDDELLHRQFLIENTDKFTAYTRQTWRRAFSNLLLEYRWIMFQYSQIIKAGYLWLSKILKRTTIHSVN